MGRVFQEFSKGSRATDRGLMNKKLAIYLTIIIAVTLLVYYPSFSHLLRGETYTYFMDSMGNQSAVSLVGNYFNYEMVRVFDAGDSLAFRPLLFSALGVQTALYGTNYIWWHVTAFLMHLTATLCLFRILWKIRPSIIVLFATILFSTSFIVLAPILYEQIAAYALFTALILSALYYIYCGVKSGKTRHLVFAAVCMLSASFFLEIGILLTVLFIGYFWIERNHPNFKWRRWALSFSVVVIIYSASYATETLQNPTSTTWRDFEKLVTTENIKPAFSNGQRLAMYWITETLYPAQFTADIDTNFRANPVNIVPDIAQFYGVDGERLYYFESERDIPVILMVFNYIAIVVIAGMLFLKPRPGKPRVSTPFLLLLTVAPFVLALANAFYRGITIGLVYLLSDANYIVYIWFALATVGLYSFISLKKLSRWHIGLLSLSLVYLVLISAPLSYRLNQEVKEDAAPVRAYFQALDSFIAERRPEDERDFSFSSSINGVDQEARMEIILWKGLPNQPDYTRFTFTMPEILYWRYWDKDSPKYTLIYHSEEDRLEVIENE